MQFAVWLLKRCSDLFKGVTHSHREFMIALVVSANSWNHQCLRVSFSMMIPCKDFDLSFNFLKVKTSNLNWDLTASGHVNLKRAYSLQGKHWVHV